MDPARLTKMLRVRASDERRELNVTPPKPWSTIADGAFLIGLVRHFDIDGSDGDLAGYVQVQCEYRYPADAELATVKYESWWFHDGAEPFPNWFARVRADPIWSTLEGHTPSAFAVWQEAV